MGARAGATLLLSTFALVFAAEWGDKSFLATIALAASSSPAGVVLGAVGGHGVATGIAVSSPACCCFSGTGQLQSVYKACHAPGTAVRGAVQRVPCHSPLLSSQRGGGQVLGGSYLGRYVSERTVQYVGGSLFLLFALATVVDVARGLQPQ